MLPDSLQKIVPGDTARTWEAIRDVVPGSAYLVGGLLVSFIGVVTRREALPMGGTTDQLSC